MAQRDYSAPPDTAGWPRVPEVLPRVCRIKHAAFASSSAKERLGLALQVAWQEAASCVPIPPQARLGIIFASTKGCIEDSVWGGDAEAASYDTLTPVLQYFLALSGLRPLRSLCISNACSSTHVAVQLAALWLGERAVSHVLILAADEVGPFVANGFASLRSLAVDPVAPFSAGRQGIQLGEAAAALLISNEPAAEALNGGNAAKGGTLTISGVDTRVEGYALTRSAENGETLAAALKAACGALVPDAVIAHGTGTVANDAMEDTAYQRFLPVGTKVSCSKWSIGHTLGASGAVDLIAAAEALKAGQLFSIGNTLARQQIIPPLAAASNGVDPALKSAYFTRDERWGGRPLSRILVATAGFGGMHGAALLEFKQ